MSYRVFLSLIILGSIISWLSLGLIIFYFDPQKISFVGFSLFYASFFVSLGGLIFLVTNFLKRKFFKDQLLYYRVRNSVRHAIFFSILIIGWAFLKSHDLLRWWNILLLILILTILEFFFISLNKERKFHPYGAENSTT